MNHMEAELQTAIDYAERLLSAGIEFVGTARVELNQHRARDPKVIALTILCRSISNFRAAVRLVQQEQVMEGRALVRLLYENLLWLGALRERGLGFVQEMIADEAFNRQALGELTLKITNKHGAGPTDPGALKLRGILKDLGQRFPSAKRLHANRTAASGPIEPLYVEYARLSLDAVHCSITALGRHLSTERTEGRDELTLSVVPTTSPEEVLSTVLHACRALMGVIIAAGEIVGHRDTNSTVPALVNEFEENGWHSRD
jgi:hypothetical protein